MIRKIIEEEFIYHEKREDVLKSRNLTETIKLFGITLSKYSIKFKSSVESNKNPIGFIK